MRQKKKQLVAEGYGAKQIRMEWNKKSIRTNDTVFKIKNGSIVDQYNITFNENTTNTSTPTIKSCGRGNGGLIGGTTHQSRQPPDKSSLHNSQQQASTINPGGHLVIEKEIILME